MVWASMFLFDSTRMAGGYGNSLRQINLAQLSAYTILDNSLMRKEGKAMNHKEQFIESISEQFSKTRAEATHIFNVFVQEKIIKFGHGGAGIQLSHGSFWDQQVMDNALSMKYRNNPSNKRAGRGTGQ